MTRALANLLGAISGLLTSLLWLSLLKPGWADHVVNGLVGARHEYRAVLGAALLAAVFALVASIRGARWWFAGLMFSVGTLGYFTYALSR